MGDYPLYEPRPLPWNITNPNYHREDNEPTPLSEKQKIMYGYLSSLAVPYFEDKGDVMEVNTTLEGVTLKWTDPPRCHFCGRNGKERTFLDHPVVVIIICDACLDIIEMIAGDVTMRINAGVKDYPIMSRR